MIKIGELMVILGSLCLMSYFLSYTDDISKIDIELGYDDETTSSLLFPNITTSYLYEKINKNHLKIHIPGFQSIQTCCPKKSWQKLIKLHPVINNQLYYIIAKHTIGKHGRSVSVNSPLQVSDSLQTIPVIHC